MVDKIKTDGYFFVRKITPDHSLWDRKLHDTTTLNIKLSTSTAHTAVNKNVTGQEHMVRGLGSGTAMGPQQNQVSDNYVTIQRETGLAVNSTLTIFSNVQCACKWVKHVSTQASPTNCKKITDATIFPAYAKWCCLNHMDGSSVEDSRPIRTLCMPCIRFHAYETE